MLNKKPKQYFTPLKIKKNTIDIVIPNDVEEDDDEVLYYPKKRKKLFVSDESDTDECYPKEIVNRKYDMVDEKEVFKVDLKYYINPHEYYILHDISLNNFFILFYFHWTFLD